MEYHPHPQHATTRPFCRMLDRSAGQRLPARDFGTNPCSKNLALVGNSSWKHGKEPHMRTLRTLLPAAVIALALASPAGAAEPAYVGTWASDLAQCKVDQSRQEAPLIMTAK